MAENKLKKYHEKRNFAVTNEPEGKVTRSKRRGLKFSVQHHKARADHYDLRLELDGVALSWAVPKGPSYNTKDKRLAMRVEDHPVDYMDFEGVIPKGEYGGGTVMLWDEGEWIPRYDPKAGLIKGSLKFQLKGTRLKGDWALVKMKPKEGEGGEPWLLIKERDEYVKETTGIGKFSRGVRSGRTMSEIAKAGTRNPFQSVDVMLARLVDALPEDKGWLYELKYDGHRVVSFSEGGMSELKTRNGYPCTRSFTVAADAVSEMLGGRAAVLDGEMVVINADGVPNFHGIQSYQKTQKGELRYVLFDLLALDGEDLRARPLVERKQKLKALMQDAPPVLSYSEHTEKMTKAGLDALKKRGMEGVVIKRKDAPYTAGKNGDWLKLKFRSGQEFVIGGFTKGDAGELKSLLVGYYEDGELKYAGRVGTGFTETTRRELQDAFRPLTQKNTPFAAISKAEAKGAVWVEPVLSAQVDYAEMTSSGLLRQASFKGLRRDKAAREVIAERPQREGEEVCGVKITHPEKVMFQSPETTKLDLAEYYAAVSERMMPYVKDRLLSLVCCPSGIGGEQFFRRHLDGDFAGVKEAGEYFYVTGEKGLVSLVQYNAVEFHVWGSKKCAPDRPDIMVFDLDPDEGLSLKDVRRGVRELKDVLDGLGLKSFLKTSGGKGYHVVVPFKSGVESQKFRDFSRGVAELMEKKYPEHYTSNMMKKARAGRIYIDWQRNGGGSTSVSAYSVRARDGAPVSVPIAWEELHKVAPNAVTMKKALLRLEQPDPWADFFKVKEGQRLKL